MFLYFPQNVKCHFFCFHKGQYNLKRKKKKKLEPFTFYWTLEMFYLPVKLNLTIFWWLWNKRDYCNTVNDSVLIFLLFLDLSVKNNKEKTVWPQTLFMITLCIHICGICIFMLHGWGVIIFPLWFLPFDICE